MELMEEVLQKRQHTERIQELEMWHKIETRHILLLLEECKELLPKGDPKKVGKLRDMKQLMIAVGQQLKMEIEKLQKLEIDFLHNKFKKKGETQQQEKGSPDQQGSAETRPKPMLSPPK